MPAHWDVAGVLGTYNRLPLLQTCLTSARAAAAGLKTIFIVVDGGSTDGTRAWLAEQTDVIMIGERGPLRGAVRAFNRAFALAVQEEVDWIVLLNDDDELLGPEPAIVKAIDLMRVSAAIGAVAFETDLRGGWSCESYLDIPYCNKGVIRRTAGMAVARFQGDPSGQAWWSPDHLHYASDTEFGLGLWKLGYTVIRGVGLRVHDAVPEDELRAKNRAEYTTAELFRRRWPDQASITFDTAAALKFGGYLPQIKTVKGITDIDWAATPRLHMGCGTHHLAGWINADGLPVPAAEIVMDIHTDLEQLPANTLDWVYWSHGPEHIYPDRLPQIIAQLQRCLKPDGKLTIATIDLEGIYQHRFKTQANGPAWNAALYGETCSYNHYYAAHRQCFDRHSLAMLLCSAGFRFIKNWEPDDYPEISQINDYGKSCRLVSVLVEGVK
jgi:predicted SAM-dependent methyltransferase